MRLIKRLEQTCLEKGDKTAIISNGIKLSFHDLWEQSNNLAAWLQKEHDDHRPVIVYGHKSPSMLVSFLACALSGHPYCPVDVSMPYVRIQDIINTIGDPLVLANEVFEAPDCTVISRELILEKSHEKGKVTEIETEDDETMYIIFTSGSSGKPKGVEISSDNLNRFTRWSKEFFQADNDSEDGNIMNQAPFSFDLSVMDTYSALVSGKTLCLLDKDRQKEVHSILSFLKEMNIGYTVSTPSFINMLLADKGFNENNYPNIKQFLFCGETLSKETAKALMTRFPKSKIINTYGPTESTVAVTSVEIKKEHLDDHHGLPIGKPKPGTYVYIENEEIIISGDTVGKGYYKDEKKTEAAFFTDNKTGMRCYRTGDKGYIEGGMLYYSGRMDNQIKLHGYRIELGDIEVNLIQVDGIEDAVVLPKKKDGQIKSLTAFVTGSVPCQSDGDFAASKYIKSFLTEKLPHYMIPKKIKFIDEMPLTNNGKKDRKRLEELL